MTPLNLEENALMGENGTGTLFIATDYDGATFADGDGTNESASIASIEADYTFADIGYFEKFAPYIKKGDEKIIQTDYCDVGEILRKVERVSGFTVDVQEIIEMQNLSLILGTELRTVAAGAGQKAEQIIGMKRKYKTTPFHLFKFVSCPDANGLRNIFYFVKGALNNDLAMNYVNLAKEDFAGVPMDFEVAKGGNFFLKKETAVATS